MAKYLIIGTYTAEGMDGISASGGSARRDVALRAVDDLGGRVESMYFAFGEDDVYVIVDLPDNVSAAALGIAVCGSGMARTKTVVLLTPEEVDEAAARPVTYRVPGA